MNTSEVAALIAIIGTFDVRAIPTDDVSLRLKVEAWHAALDLDMPFGEARDIVVDHYGKTDDPVTCGILNFRWHAAHMPRGLPAGVGDREPDPPSPEYLAAKAALTRTEPTT